MFEQYKVALRRTAVVIRKHAVYLLKHLLCARRIAEGKRKKRHVRGTVSIETQRTLKKDATETIAISDDDDQSNFCLKLEA